MDFLSILVCIGLLVIAGGLGLFFAKFEKKLQKKVWQYKIKREWRKIK